MVQFPDKDFKALENQALAGDRAREVSNSAEWRWIKEFILGALHDQAVNTLKNARTEEDRMKAQQMFLASDKPEDLINFLISQGDAATASLKEIASQEEAFASNNPTLNGASQPKEDEYA